MAGSPWSTTGTLPDERRSLAPRVDNFSHSIGAGPRADVLATVVPGRTRLANVFLGGCEGFRWPQLVRGYELHAHPCMKRLSDVRFCVRKRAYPVALAQDGEGCLSYRLS